MAAVIPAITTAAPTIFKVAQVFSAASTVMGVLGSVKQGRTKRKSYELQAEMERLKATREGLRERERANQALEEVRRVNAAIVARSFAGGVSGFSGSANLVQAVNNTKYGRDYQNSLNNLKAINNAGAAQSLQYVQASKEATRQGWLNASTALTTGAFTYGQLGQLSSASASTSSSMPVGLASAVG